MEVREVVHGEVKLCESGHLPGSFPPFKRLLSGRKTSAKGKTLLANGVTIPNREEGGDILTSKSFRLLTDLVAIELFRDSTRAIGIPADSIVQVTDEICQTDHRMVNGSWDGRPVVIFGRDVQQRMVEVRSLTVTA